MKNILSIVFIKLSLLAFLTIFTSVSASECNVFHDLNKISGKITIDNINLSCIHQLNSDDYDKFVSVVLREIDTQNASSESTKEIYKALIDGALDKYKKTQNLTDGKNLLRLIDSQKFFALQSYFDDDCIPLNNSNLSPDAGTAVLYMHAISDYDFISIFIMKDAIYLSNIFNIKNINHHINEFTKAIISLKRNNKSDERISSSYVELKYHARFVYDRILQPFKLQLDKIKHLVVIPDVSTGIFPVEALWDGAEHVLNKGYSISYSPNLARSVVYGSSNQDFLFASLGSIKNERATNLGYNLEFGNIKELFPSLINRQGEDATQYNLLNTINKYPINVMHIATHAEFKDPFSESYIELYPDKKGQNKLYVKDFERMMLSSSARKIPPDLLVLSACETAKGGDGTTNASLGLAGIAARSGINSVIASLWLVTVPEALSGPISPKDNSGNVNDYFYRIINDPKPDEKGMTKAQALQKSKRAMQKDRSIYDWAAFVLVGDWGEIK